jgi:hypothetical protein
MRTISTAIPDCPTTRSFDPRDPTATVAPTTEVQHAAQSRVGISMESALRQQADLLARKSEEESGATAEARTWLRSRSTQKALLDLTTMVLGISKRLGSNVTEN